MGGAGNPCPVCGTASSAGAGSCARCGAVLPIATHAAPASRRLRAAARAAGSPDETDRIALEPQHGGGGRGAGGSSGSGGSGGDPLETLPIEDPGAGPSGEDTAAIGRGFELGEELGRGGTSSVHSARQRSLARLVAVKTLGRSGNGNAEFRRFRAEALATAHLEHPNIVPVHDLASAPDGTLMLAMKRVEGTTWQALLHPHHDSERQRARATKLDDHLAFLSRVCDGIAYAHSRGIIHADLKPANVLIGDYGEVVITDWGCAVAYGPGAPAQIPRPCEIATLRGSPAYLAPEIATGRIHTISTRTDIFQLGAILYEVLTGSPPYSGTHLGEVIAQAAACRIKPPAAPSGGNRPPDELCDLAMQSMSLEPTARPRSVRAFAARLADYRRHAAATELAEAARAQLDSARRTPDEGEEHFHRAIAYCERALELWPEHALGRDQLTEARIAYAHFALATRAFHLARSQATSAAAPARARRRYDLPRRAEALAESAQVSAVQERRRLRHFTLLRTVLIATSLIALAGAIMGATLLLAQSHALAEAERIAHAQQVLAERTRARSASQTIALREVAPTLLARAEAAAREGRWADAAATATAAKVADPRLPRARLLVAVSLAMQGWYSAAQGEIERWRALAPDEPLAIRADLLIARMSQLGSAHPGSQDHAALYGDAAAQLRALIEPPRP